MQASFLTEWHAIPVPIPWRGPVLGTCKKGTVEQRLLAHQDEDFVEGRSTPLPLSRHSVTEEVRVCCRADVGKSNRTACEGASKRAMLQTFKLSERLHSVDLLPCKPCITKGGLFFSSGQTFGTRLWCPRERHLARLDDSQPWWHSDE
jgi:hypothetical protein